MPATTTPCSVCAADVDISDMPYLKPGGRVMIYCSSACADAATAGMWKAPDDTPATVQKPS